MLRLVPILLALALTLLGEPALAQGVGPGAARSIMPSIGAAAEPARLCGTNSSRSRRCNFGHRDCIASGKSQERCDRALAICRSCITGMVACMRQTSTACSTCTDRYSTCMQPWVELMD